MERPIFSFGRSSQGMVLVSTTVGSVDMNGDYAQGRICVCAETAASDRALTGNEATATLAGIMTTLPRFVFATVLVAAVAAPATRASAAEGGRDAPPMG